MERVVIVGSGASGVHFALSVLEKGYEVLMLDVGHQGPEPAGVETFNGLKDTLQDPVEHFLGANFEGVLFPDDKSEFYGIPPSKQYVFSNVDMPRVKTAGFSPLVSFAQGGLAQAWTGGAYPFDDDDLADFPFGYADLKPYYEQVARRIGITGVDDDLARFMPVHENLLKPLRLDRHSALLLADYERQKAFFNSTLQCYVGRSRVAALTQAMDDRRECSYLGRCLWGCPSGAFYTPSLTLRRCKEFANFRYLPGLHVAHFIVDSRGRVKSVKARSVSSKNWEEFPLDTLVLAGGTLSSSAIVLASIFQHTGEIVRLEGLMDNRQVLMPFVNLKLIGQPHDPESYQYHQIAMRVEGSNPREYAHGLITTLKSGLVHPIAQHLPFDLRTSILLVRNLHAALGLVNVNLHDSRRDTNYITLQPNSDSETPSLAINYSPRYDEATSIRRMIQRFKRALRTLKCFVPPRMLHVRPMGASVHYAGTLPMSATHTSLTTSSECQSHDFKNLYVVDGSTFPSLPAKNITFTLMANAVRVADHAF